MSIVVLLVALGLAPLLASSQSTPTAYHLKIDIPDLSTASTFNGSVEVNITVHSSTYQLVLDCLNLNISRVSVLRRSHFTTGGWAAEAVSGINVNESKLSVVFQQPLLPTIYRLNVVFQGVFQNKTMAGFAKVGYQFRKTQKYLGVTSLGSNNARSVFPCYDEPGHRIDFVLDVTVNKSQTVLSNIKPTYVHNVTDTMKVFRFDSYPSMEVNQLGWVVMDHTTYLLQTANASTTVIHTRAPYPYSNHTSWACEVTAHLLDSMSTYTGQEYPFDKMEQIVVPEFFSGSTTGWGIISYSEEALLVTPERTSAHDTQQVALELAKGIAQQWCGGLVSMNSWNNTWLMEGIAEYLKYTVSASLPEMCSWELIEQMVVELVQPALSLDTAQHALNVYYHGDDLSRYKGGAVVQMLNNILGDAVFKNALGVYLADSTFMSNEPSDFWNTLYEAARGAQVDLALQSVEGVMAEWVTAPGYPVLNVTGNNTHFNISQPVTSRWYVPVTYMLEGTSSVYKTWLQPGSSRAVPVSGSRWILVNINQTGFYRVQYSPVLWRQLMLSGVTQLPRLSRAALTDDLFGFTISGGLSTDQLLEYTGFLRTETDYYPWHTTLRNYQSLLDRMYGHSSYQMLQKYLLSLMSKVIAEVGFVSKTQDSHTDKLRRAIVLQKACALGHNVCVQKAVSILRSWMASTYYDADLSTALLCAGVANSSTAVWHSVWSMYQYSVVPSVRAAILKALTCSRDVPLLKQFLTNITSTAEPLVSEKDKTILLQTLASTPPGAEVLLDWLLARLYSQMKNSTSRSIVTNSATSTSEAPVTSSLVTSNQSATQENPDGSLEETSEETTPAVILTDRVVTTTERIKEEDVATILSYVTPKLTTLEQGSKMDAFLTQNSTGLSAATLQLMRDATLQVYTNAGWAATTNGKMAVWLENALSTDVDPDRPSSPTINSTTPKPSGAVTICSSLALGALATLVHFSTTV